MLKQILTNIFKLQTSIPGLMLVVSSIGFLVKTDNMDTEILSSCIAGIVGGLSMILFGKSIIPPKDKDKEPFKYHGHTKVIIFLILSSLFFQSNAQQNYTAGDLRVEDIFPLSVLPAYPTRNEVKFVYGGGTTYFITMNDTLFIPWINAHTNPYDTSQFLTWADTLNRIATTWQIDTTSTRIQTIANTALFWPDTLNKIATKYQLDTLSSGALPGGSNTQLQYKVNSNTFGGIPGSVFDGTNTIFSAGYFQADQVQIDANVIEAQSNNLILDSDIGDIITNQNLRPGSNNVTDLGEQLQGWKDFYLYDDWNTTNGTSTTAFIEDTSVYALIKKHAPSATPAGVGTELQYRNGSNFGAVTGSTWNGSRLGLTANVSFNNVIPFSGNEVSFDTPDNNTLSVGNNTLKYYGSSDWLELSGIDGDLYTRGYLYSYDVNQYHFNDTSFQELVEKYAPSPVGTSVNREILYNNAGTPAGFGDYDFSTSTFTLEGDLDPVNLTSDIGSASKVFNDLYIERVLLKDDNSGDEITLSASGVNGSYTVSFPNWSGSPMLFVGTGLQTYTVGTLPAGTAYQWAIVTDALAPSYNSTVVGGGAVVIPVWYDGTNWTCR